jgi:hypothetical protein
MLEDQNTSDVSVADQAARPGQRLYVPHTQEEAQSDGEASTVWGIHRDGTRPLTYCDYYCIMSLADFLAWCQKDDGSAPPISLSKT